MNTVETSTALLLTFSGWVAALVTTPMEPDTCTAKACKHPQPSAAAYNQNEESGLGELLNLSMVALAACVFCGVAVWNRYKELESNKKRLAKYTGEDPTADYTFELKDFSHTKHKVRLTTNPQVKRTGGREGISVIKSLLVEMLRKEGRLSDTVPSNVGDIAFDMELINDLERSTFNESQIALLVMLNKTKQCLKMTDFIWKNNYYIDTALELMANQESREEAQSLFNTTLVKMTAPHIMLYQEYDFMASKTIHRSWCESTVPWVLKLIERIKREEGVEAIEAYNKIRRYDENQVRMWGQFDLTPEEQTSGWDKCECSVKSKFIISEVITILERVQKRERDCSAKDSFTEKKVQERVRSVFFIITEQYNPLGHYIWDLKTLALNAPNHWNLEDVFRVASEVGLEEFVRHIRQRTNWDLQRSSSVFSETSPGEVNLLKLLCKDETLPPYFSQCYHDHISLFAQATPKQIAQEIRCMDYGFIPGGF